MSSATRWGGGMKWMAVLLWLPCAMSCSTPDPHAQPVVGEVAAEIPDQINKHYREITSEGVETWIQRFEAESREIFAQRDDIAGTVPLQPGDDVADVGSGSGIFSKLFAQRVGSAGTVYAVDIVEAFLERVDGLAAQDGLTNIETVLCTEQSVELAERCVDAVFICDTYHHFAYPRSSLASIYRALRPGGTLVLVDFKRIPGVSRDWVLGHVRAGAGEVRAEVEAAGFEYLDVNDELLKENYVMRFRKRS